MNWGEFVDLTGLQQGLAKTLGLEVPGWNFPKSLKKIQIIEVSNWDSQLFDSPLSSSGGVPFFYLITTLAN